MATHIWGNGMEFENPLVVTLDNKLVYETVIGGEEDMKLYDQVQNGALDRVNARLKNIRFTATAGPHKIGVAFKRRTFAESDDQLQMFAPGGGQDRLYRVNSFQLQGPFNAKGLSATPSRERIFSLPARPGTADAGGLRQDRSSRRSREARVPAAGLRRGRERAAAVLPGRREGRRLRGAASAAPSPVCWRARSSCTAASTSRRACARRHLRDQRSRARVEAVVLPLEHDSRRRAAAARRSSGKLSEPAVLDRQVRRMLADPRSMTLASNFVPPVARHEAPRRDRAGPGGVPVCVRPIRSARRISAPS